ncbi:ORF3 [Grizzly bear anellovirus 6]|nr:ORF3 [Grizzly bear anellovirus 6]
MNLVDLLHSWLRSRLLETLKPSGLDISFSSSSEDTRSEDNPPPTPSKRVTSAPPATPQTARRASILKTSQGGGSSKKRLMRELLEALSEPGDAWWRSSPNLFASDSESSERESDGPTKRARGSQRSNFVSETPTWDTGSQVSGVWSGTSSSDVDSDAEIDRWVPWEELKGGEVSPPPPPPSNEDIYQMLRELDNKKELCN